MPEWMPDGMLLIRERCPTRHEKAGGYNLGKYKPFFSPKKMLPYHLEKISRLRAPALPYNSLINYDIYKNKSLFSMYMGIILLINLDQSAGYLSKGSNMKSTFIVLAILIILGFVQVIKFQISVNFG